MSYIPTNALLQYKDRTKKLNPIEDIINNIKTGAGIVRDNVVNSTLGQPLTNLPQGYGPTLGDTSNALGGIIGSGANGLLAFLNPQSQNQSSGYISPLAAGNPQPTPTLTPYPTAVPTPTDAPIPSNLANLQQDPGGAYNQLIMHASQQYGIPAPLLKATLAHESQQFDPQYINGYHTDKTGRGIAAIDKKWHPEISDEQAFNPSFAIPWAANALKSYKDQEGNWAQALRKYNGGNNYNSDTPGYGGRPVKQLTLEYAANVFKQLQKYGQ